MRQEITNIELFHEKYVKIVDEFFNYCTNPSAYPYYAKENCDVYIIDDDSDFFEEKSLCYSDFKKRGYIWII